MDETKEIAFRVAPKAGFTPVIGHLVSMMDYARFTTLRAVEGLSVDALDFLLDNESNSIGMLLAHMAAVEEYFQGSTLGFEFGSEAAERIELAMNLGQPAREAIKGQPLERYLEGLAGVRARTLDALRDRTDEWLFEEVPIWGGYPANNYFKWFHVFEDELSHRGQIRVLRRLALAASGSVV